MKPTLEYSRYQDWGGTLSEDEFAAQRPTAQDQVNNLIGYNDVTGNEDAYLNAVCAAIEAAGKADETGKGFTLGAFSVNGDSSATPAGAAMQAAMNALTGTGLLWQGL